MVRPCSGVPEQDASLLHATSVRLYTARHAVEPGPARKWRGGSRSSGSGGWRWKHSAAAESSFQAVLGVPLPGWPHHETVLSSHLSHQARLFSGAGRPCRPQMSCVFSAALPSRCSSSLFASPPPPSPAEHLSHSRPPLVFHFGVFPSLNAIIAASLLAASSSSIRLLPLPRQGLGLCCSWVASPAAGNKAGAHPTICDSSTLNP